MFNCNPTLVSLRCIWRNESSTRLWILPLLKKWERCFCCKRTRHLSLLLRKKWLTITMFNTFLIFTLDLKNRKWLLSLTLGLHGCGLQRRIATSATALASLTRLCQPLTNKHQITQSMWCMDRGRYMDMRVSMRWVWLPQSVRNICSSYLCLLQETSRGWAQTEFSGSLHPIKALKLSCS